MVLMGPDQFWISEIPDESIMYNNHLQIIIKDNTIIKGELKNIVTDKINSVMFLCFLVLNYSTFTLQQ